MGELIIMQDTVNILPEKKLNALMEDPTKKWDQKLSGTVIYYKQIDKPEEVEEEIKK